MLPSLNLNPPATDAPCVPPAAIDVTAEAKLADAMAHAAEWMRRALAIAQTAAATPESRARTRRLTLADFELQLAQGSLPSTPVHPQ